MTTVAIPRSQVRNSRKGLWLAVPVGLMALATVGWVLLRGTGQNTGAIVAGTYYKVVPMSLEVKVVKDGELQAMQNIDIICKVEGSTAIQELVNEGASVKKGDVLVLLDSSSIKQKLDDTTLAVQRAEADLITSQEMREIQASQNDSNLEAARVALQLANLDLQQYASPDGSYQQQLASAQTEKKMAEISLQNAQQELQQERNLFSKGYVMAADVKKYELAVTTAQNSLNKASTALEVLSKYTHEMDLTAKKNAVAQADSRLSRQQRENKSQMNQREADVRAKEFVLTLQKRWLEHVQEQYDNCTIKAPADGMVVYSTSTDRHSQTSLAEGVQVRERQSLLTLPDTTAMKVVLRIQEAQVNKLKEGQRAMVKIVGVSRSVGATVSKISVLPDSSNRWWNPDLKEYPVDVTLDETPENLKPGMGAQAEIYIDRISDVLAVPLAAIYSAGKDNYVFVRQSEKAPKAIKVELGRTNETHAEIKDGLSEDEEVLLLQAGQGRELAEKAGIKVEPTTRPSAGKRKRGGAPAATPTTGPTAVIDQVQGATPAA